VGVQVFPAQITDFRGRQSFAQLLAEIAVGFVG